MTRAEMLTELRVLLRDTVAPYKWSDDTLLIYTSEGQDSFCEETGFFIDKSTYTVTTTAGEQNYDLDPRIIKVLEVWDGARRLRQFTENDRPISVALAATNTIPSNWQTDAELGKLTFYEPPVAGAVLTLRVWRYAAQELTHKTAGLYDAELEIPARFHRSLIEYAAFKAFSHHDQELQDPIKARDHKLEFDDLCKKGARAFRRLAGGEVYLAPSPLYSFR